METEQVVIAQKELDLLKKHLKDSNLSDFNKKKLLTELEYAKIMKDNELPDDAIGMDSEVEIQDTESGRQFTFQIVLPADADMKKNKISVFAPIGIALIGYRTGAKIQWEMPDGVKKFKILKVTHKIRHED